MVEKSTVLSPLRGSIVNTLVKLYTLSIMNNELKTYKYHSDKALYFLQIERDELMAYYHLRALQIFEVNHKDYIGYCKGKGISYVVSNVDDIVDKF
jgi:hypothetical protein